MSDAPERIWATEDKENFGEDKFHTTRPMKGLTEYIRADLVATLRARVADLEEAVEQAAKDARDVFSEYPIAKEAVDYMEQLIYAALRDKGKE